jgi:hypothetical protein
VGRRHVFRLGSQLPEQVHTVPKTRRIISSQVRRKILAQ